jgi:hypothetical protein
MNNVISINSSGTENYFALKPESEGALRFSTNVEGTKAYQMAGHVAKG